VKCGTRHKESEIVRNESAVTRKDDGTLVLRSFFLKMLARSDDILSVYSRKSVVGKLIALITLGLSLAAQGAVREPDNNCTTTREFVTTLEYLRKHMATEFPEPAARQLAMQVTQGCTGAAHRFILITRALTKAELPMKDAAQFGLEFSKKTDRETAAFIAVFEKAFLKDFMDLDLKSSIQLARSLTSEFDGDMVAARDDFEKLLELCVKRKITERPMCAEFAARIAKRGQPWSGGMAEAYIRVIEFNDSSMGPGLNPADSFKLAEDLISRGPGAADNYIQAYRYAISPKGMAFAPKDAQSFAQQLAMPKP